MVKKNDIADPVIKRLIADKMPLVEKIARNLSRRLPASVERDDLLQDGLVGLIDAILRWTRDTTGSHFDNYVAQRAHGAMLDGLRVNDPGSRGLRRAMREAEQVIQRLGHQKGRLPQESEVAQAMGLDIADYQRMLQDVQGYALISLEDIAGSDNIPAYLEYCTSRNIDPLRVLERNALRLALHDAIVSLPEQKREVLRLYYEGELRMHEIGLSLHISEARVSQLHSHTIAQLRAIILGGDQGAAVLKPRTQVRPDATRPP
jgi:RNA polymerase sigma factor for flagellar operon FliA